MDYMEKSINIKLLEISMDQDQVIKVYPLINIMGSGTSLTAC